MAVNADAAGVWELARWGRMRGDRGRVAFDDARGRLIYDPTGFMAAQLERSSLSDPRHKQVYSYSGTWRIDGATAHHAVDLSNLPEWIGTTLTRTVLLLDATRLHLETPPVAGRSGDLRDVLEWVRADRGAIDG